MFLRMLACLFLLTMPVSAHSDWLQDGVPICPTLGSRTSPLVIGDGAGGAFISWVGVGNQEDAYVQHITTAGDIAPGWPLGGVPVSTAGGGQWITSLALDGTGGVYLAWEDWRDNATNGYDVYAHHVLASGIVDPRWPVDGLAVAAFLEEQRLPSIASDGAGGAFVAWQDRRNGGPGFEDIYLQHLLANGVPPPGWADGGNAVCSASGPQGLVTILSDGEGGVFLTWADVRSAETSTDVYALRINSAGLLVDGWAANGNLICGAPALQGSPSIAADDSGGVFVAWRDYRSQPAATSDPDRYADVYLQRVTSSGVIASGWPVDGLPVCTAPRLQQDIHVVSDGAGGALLVWSDYRSLIKADVYVHHIGPNAALIPGWPVDGLLASTATGYDVDPRIAPDGIGGAYIAFADLTDTYKVLAQHLTASGTVAAGWLPEGRPMAATNSTQQHPGIAADGYGGAIVAWDDSRIYNIYAQQVGPGGATPVAISLVSARAEPDRATLTWEISESASSGFVVQRRSPDTDWIEVGLGTLQEKDRLVFEDDAVQAGQRYAYRVGYGPSGALHFSVETWVDVPIAFALTLDGFRPNPARGTPRVRFTLRDASTALLEGYDVSGRQVLKADLTALGPGRHQVALGPSLAPGVYYLRLRQSGLTKTVRGLVIR